MERKSGSLTRDSSEGIEALWPEPLGSSGMAPCRLGVLAPGNPDEAGKLTNRALEFTPDDPFLIVNKGHVLLLSGRRDEVIAQYRSVHSGKIEGLPIDEYVVRDLKDLQGAGVSVPNPAKVADEIRRPTK